MSTESELHHYNNKKFVINKNAANKWTFMVFGENNKILGQDVLPTTKRSALTNARKFIAWYRG